MFMPSHFQIHLFRFFQHLTGDDGTPGASVGVLEDRLLFRAAVNPVADTVSPVRGRGGSDASLGRCSDAQFGGD